MSDMWIVGFDRGDGMRFAMPVSRVKFMSQGAVGMVIFGDNQNLVALLESVRCVDSEEMLRFMSWTGASS